MYTPALPVAAAGNESNLPSDDLLIRMFPKEDMKSWIGINQVTPQSIQVTPLLNPYYESTKKV